MDAPLGLAFSAGMLVTVNPCGFAMLPAYLGYFLGIEGGDGDLRASVTRALEVGLSVSAGFLLAFGVAGVALHQLSASVYEWAPWLTIVVGAVLVVLGLAMLRGYEPTVALPKLDRGGRGQDGRSMFVFGVSYAVASLSCALPAFLAVVVGTFRRENVVSSLAVFVAYSLGMTLVLVALTVSLAMTRQGLLRRLRQAMPFVNRASGLLIVVVGGYLIHYGWYERRVRAGDVGEGSAIVDRVTGWSSDVATWVGDIGSNRLGLLLALGLATVLTATFGVRTRRRS
jgi:cytochrome c biogenesis protein CcdA